MKLKTPAATAAGVFLCAAVSMASALHTVKDYIDDARILLQDAIAPYRYDDPSLITALNLTLLEGRRIRADLFVFWKCNQETGVQFFPATAVTNETVVFMESQFRLAFLHGLVAHALERDQEDVQDTRASTFMATFYNMLGIKPPAPQGQA